MSPVPISTGNPEIQMNTLSLFGSPQPDTTISPADLSVPLPSAPPLPPTPKLPRKNIVPSLQFGMLDKHTKAIMVAEELEKVNLEEFTPVKWPDGALDGRSQLLMLNLIRSLEQMKKKLGRSAGIFKNTARLVSAWTGVSERTVLRISGKSEQEVVGQLKKPEVTPSKKRRAEAALKGLPEGLAEALCAEMPLWWKAQINVTVQSIQKWMFEEFDFEACESTVGRVLHSLGFSHKKKSYNPLVNGKQAIINWRCRYIPDICSAREAGVLAFYFDETWLFSGQNSLRGWCGKAGDPYAVARQGAVEGVFPGPVMGNTKGQRAIVMAVLGEDGILAGSEEIIISGTKPGDQKLDYHKEVSSQMTEDYMKIVIPLIAQQAIQKGRPACLIIDNAPYHCRALDKLPTSSSKKSDLQDFLLQKGVPFSNEKRPKLLEMVKDWIDQRGGRKALTHYWLDDYAYQKGVRIMRLPPYHCHLNPIELVWQQLKQFIKSIGTSSDKLPVIRERALRWLQEYTPEAAEKTIQHVIQTELAINDELLAQRALAQQISTVVHVPAGSSDDDDDDEDAP